MVTYVIEVKDGDYLKKMRAALGAAIVREGSPRRELTQLYNALILARPLRTTTTGRFAQARSADEAGDE